jgi:hypothetical protein
MQKLKAKPDQAKTVESFLVIPMPHCKELCGMEMEIYKSWNNEPVSIIVYRVYFEFIGEFIGESIGDDRINTLNPSIDTDKITVPMNIIGFSRWSTDKVSLNYQGIFHFLL